ncbi:MAG TPA: hypothetical protein DDZ43_09725 [Hyphomonadaceae bacterium]|nr:hypothetical protein [Hyphomonadaceae bacterium]HBJ93143.1 hypothetical protein [Hyphomonadaceae bacterium]|tara:strand:- start:18294 stop:18842 length:549 start_codon:yes stop_codon:yes gene_type:complete
MIAKMKRAGLQVLLASLMLVAACTAPGLQNAFASGPTIFLVRHAEKEAGTDPLLTAEGEARAARLGEIMEELGVDAVWSSDTRRTRATAAPAANAEGLEVQIYDLDAMEEFADTLRNSSGTILVLGHSNTTPVLAAMLTGRDEGPWFDEADYESLFRIEFNRRGEPLSFQMSYDALERYAFD